MAENAKSFPAMGTWIEIGYAPYKPLFPRPSFPAMGTWIEISSPGALSLLRPVSYTHLVRRDLPQTGGPL